jgi:hypothetical protein
VNGSVALHSSRLLSLQETVRLEQKPFQAATEHTDMAQAKNSVQKIQKTPLQQLQTARQNPPFPTKNSGTIMPPPQSARIMQRYVSGESIRRIAREEQRDRATVTKIVRSDEMNAFVQKLREEYYGLGFEAMDAVRHALRIQKDGRLGHQLLEDIGVIPSAEERCAMAAEETIKVERASLTPFEAAITEDEEGQMLGGNMFQVAYGAACAMEESAENFDVQLPTPEEIRFRRKVAKAADEMTGGRFLQISMTDGPEEKRIRQLAEKKVKRQEARQLPPAHFVRRALPRQNQTAKPVR